MQLLVELLSLLEERPGDNNTGAWYIVRISDDAIASGPYDNLKSANRDTARLKWWDAAEYSIEYGTVDVEKSDKFDVFKELPLPKVSEAKLCTSGEDGGDHEHHFAQGEHHEAQAAKLKRQNSASVDALAAVKAHSEAGAAHHEAAEYLKAGDLPTAQMYANRANKAAIRAADLRGGKGVTHGEIPEHDSSLSEGVFVVKNRDGVEKRFKNADSPEAKAWKDSEKPAKAKVAKYSNDWWHDQLDKADDHNFVVPWDKLADRDSDAIDKVVNDQFNVDKIDWTLLKAGDIVRDGTNCATRVVRVSYEYGPGDDMGVDEPTSDSQLILVARNPKSPERIDFVRFM